LLTEHGIIGKQKSAVPVIKPVSGLNGFMGMLGCFTTGGKSRIFSGGNLFQVFLLVLPQDFEVARTRKRGVCGLDKKSLWLAFLS